MPKGMDCRRYRFSVPDADVAVQQWLSAQLNLSSSLRALIREDIQRNGFTDVTCRDVVQGAKRGRPTNAEIEARLQQQEDTEEKHKSVKQEPFITPVVKEPVSENKTSQVITPEQKTVQPVVREPLIHSEQSDVMDNDGFVDPEKLLGF